MPSEDENSSSVHLMHLPSLRKEQPFKKVPVEQISQQLPSGPQPQGVHSSRYSVITFIFLSPSPAASIGYDTVFIRLGVGLIGARETISIRTGGQGVCVTASKVIVPWWALLYCTRPTLNPRPYSWYINIHHVEIESILTRAQIAASTCNVHVNTNYRNRVGRARRLQACGCAC